MKVRVILLFYLSLTVSNLSFAFGEEWRKIKGWEDDFEGKTSQCADWEIYPTTPWNYALEIERSGLEKSFMFEKRPIENYIFDNELVPVVLKAMGRRLPDWKLTDSDPRIPQRKLKIGERAYLPPAKPETTEPLEELTLLPYGAARLRITEFPVLWK